MFIWLSCSFSQATRRGVRKGIKLDFKSIDIVRETLVIVKSLEHKASCDSWTGNHYDGLFSQINFPLWMNADIVLGPGGAENRVIDPHRFLQLSREFFPAATLSTGYVTDLPAFPQYTPRKETTSIYFTAGVAQSIIRHGRNAMFSSLSLFYGPELVLIPIMKWFGRFSCSRTVSRHSIMSHEAEA